MQSNHDYIIKMKLNTIRLNILTIIKIHHEIIGPAGAGPAVPTPTPLRKYSPWSHY